MRIHDNTLPAGGQTAVHDRDAAIFDDAVRDKADDHSAELVSMDDEFIYGPEFHRTFGDAVERGLLGLQGAGVDRRPVGDGTRGCKRTGQGRRGAATR